MSQLSEKIENWDLFEDHTACDNCWGCGWLIKELNIPFYEITFEKLLPGDELIRCYLCNGAPKAGTKPSVKKYEDTVC